MRGERICALACLAVVLLAPAARGQTPYDELTGVLEVTGDEASVGGVRLVYVPPQTGVDLDPLLAQTADNVRPMNGLVVHVTGELRGDILWGARVIPADQEERPSVEYFGPAAEFDELTGVLEVNASGASIAGVRLIYVPFQTRVDVRDLLAQTASNVRALGGQRVHATGQLHGDILWNALVERAEEEEVEEVLEEAVEEEEVEVEEGVETPIEEPMYSDPEEE